MKVQNILITGNLYKEMKELIDPVQLRQSFRFMNEEDVAVKDLQWADAYVAFKPVPDFEFFNIKWVHSTGAGVDGFLFGREWKEDVLLTRTVCSFGQRISQYCLSYVLKDLQRHDYFLQKQSTRDWQPMTPELVSKQNVLIYGTGEIGQEVAKQFASFGLNVYGVSLSGEPTACFRGVYPIFSEGEVLNKADIVINTLPLTEKTNRLFGKEFFSELNEAVFINVGRGKSVVEAGLLEAVENKKVRLAVLDVFEEEPLPVDSPLWEKENIIITPHISAVTTAKEAAACFLETLDKIEKNEPLENKADPENGY